MRKLTSEDTANICYYVDKIIQILDEVDDDGYENLCQCGSGAWENVLSDLEDWKQGLDGAEYRRIEFYNPSAIE